MNNARIFVQSLDIPDKFKNDQLHENDGLRKEFTLFDPVSIWKQIYMQK